MNTASDPKAELRVLRTRLVSWLVDKAYPLWSIEGIDGKNFGFIETLGQNGMGMPHPRRARVHPRQIYAFAQAPGFGWEGDVGGIVSRGLAYFVTHYRRADGLFRTLAAVDGSPLDERAVLYDQAFALLGYSAAAMALDSVSAHERLALDLRHAIESRLAVGDGSFFSSETHDAVRESNPHMHLLEACLAWAEIGNDPGWTEWVRSLVTLAVSRFVRQGTGSLGESFAPNWQATAGTAGRIVEPGHQFEWAWLLMRSESRCAAPLRAAALRLIAIGEGAGVRNQVAINSLLDDLTPHDANARFWPQTERLKASLLAADFTQDPAYWMAATTAARSIFPYLDTQVPGLWHDVQLPSGEMIDSPAPASTFYHLVGAIVVLDKVLGP